MNPPETYYLVFYALTGVFLLAATGYGAVFCRWCFPGYRADLGFAASVGIAILVFWGGIFNALGMAFGISLDLILGAGVVLLVGHTASTLSHAEQRSRLVAECLEAVLEPGLWLAGAVFLFSAMWLVPTTAFNPHDDLAQYLFRPYHMLQFGSVGANWFDSTGADSLGAQSWMQAFFLNRLPAGYVDAFDRIICFALSCALVVSIGRALGVPRGYRFAAVAVLIFISPSAVNISAIYSLSLSVLGLTLSLLLFARAYFADRVEPRRWIRALLPSVLFVAALAALKFTTLVFIAAVGFLFLFAAAITFRSWRDVRVALLTALTASLVALGPWAFVFLPVYMASLSSPPSDPQLAFTWAQILRYWWREHSIHGLQLDPVQYGQRGLVTTIAVFLMLVAPAISAWWRAGKRSISAEAFTIGLIGPSAALCYLIGPALFPWGYLRYSAPFVIAGFPVAALFILSAARASDPDGVLRQSFANASASALALGAVAIVIALTAQDLDGRLRLALESRTTMLLAGDNDLHSNVTRLLGRDETSRIRAMQERVPPGRRILAVIVAPTHLDLARNPSYALFVAAMSSPWWGDLGEATPEQVRTLLHERGIEYVIWQRAGDWVVQPKSVEESGDHPIFSRPRRNYLALNRAFESLKMGRIVYANDHFLMFRIEPDFAGPASLHSYELGSTTDFALGGDFNYGVSGWSERETTGMWSIDKTAKLLFQLDEPPRLDVTLVARFMAFVVPEHHPKTTVDVEVNGKPVGRWTVTSMEPTTRCVDIPRELGGDGTLRVSFHVDGPPSPARLGQSEDARNLGILLKDVTITASGAESFACSQ